MASALTTQKLFANFKFIAVDHDPGATTAILASPDGGTTPVVLDMRDYTCFGVVASPTVGSGGITKVEIIGSTDAAFTTPVVVKDSGAVAADALIDYVALEATEQDFIDAGTDLRYAAARLTMPTGTDEAKVFYIGEARRPQKDLTATTIS